MQRVHIAALDAVDDGGTPPVHEEEDLPMIVDRTALRERLAALAHAQWSGWMDYEAGKSEDLPDGRRAIPASLVARWDRQRKTPYAELPPNEQESDRMEADRVIAVLVELGVLPEAG